MSTIFSDLHPRAAQFMENLTAIAAGLVLRYVVGVVSNNDLKITSTLIGLWEGIVLLHFQQKMRHSWDPYVAYAVRLFIDFLATESIARFILVILWSGIGMVLADIAPAIWEDTGMRRFWSRFRRDLHIISRSLPILPKPSRTVRFSPSRTTSVVTSAPSSVQSTPAPSVISAITPQPPIPPTPRRKSRWPGALDSETETDRNSVLSNGQESQGDYTPSAVPPSDLPLDDDDIYASSSSESTTTEQPDLDIPEIHVEPEVEPEPVTTPRVLTIILPPTPSDSVANADLAAEDHAIIPPSADVPTIPDLPETVDILGNEDWEKLDIEDVPTPPAKDTDPIDTQFDLDLEPAKPVSISNDVQDIEPEPEDLAQQPSNPPADAEETAQPTAAADEAPVPRINRHLSLPPSFSELYPDEPLDPPQEVSQPPPAEKTAERSPSPISSIASSSPKTLSLKEALDLRNQIAPLAKERDELIKDGKAVDTIEKKIKKLTKKADSRSLNAGSPETTIELNANVTPAKTVELIEERLYQLLAPESDATSLEITVAKASKGRPMKTAIVKAVEGHDLDITEDPNNGRILRIALPIDS